MIAYKVTCYDFRMAYERKEYGVAYYMIKGKINSEMCFAPFCADMHKSMKQIFV